MYELIDEASGTREMLDDEFIESRLRGSGHMKFYTHLCNYQFTTHPLEISELDTHLEGALSDADITELSITITYELEFEDQRKLLYNEYVDIIPTNFAYSGTDIIDVNVDSFVRNGETHSYDYTELLSLIREYLSMMCRHDSAYHSVFKRRFDVTPTLYQKNTIEDLYTTGEQ